MRYYENECGLFYVNQSGALLRFVGKPKATWRNGAHMRVYRLEIPEGIRALGCDAFAGYQVEDLCLPVTLEEVGDRAFSGSMIGNIRFTGAGQPAPVLLERLAHLLRFAFSWNMEKQIREWGREYLDIYQGKGQDPDSRQILRNVSGEFLVDSDGMLMECRLRAGKDEYGRQTIARLCIPEGVQGISRELLRWVQVEEELVLPRSLRYVGYNSFASCSIPRVTLPDRLEVLDCYAFAYCRIGTLALGSEFGKKLQHIPGRQFKDGSVEEYRIPVSCREVLKSYSEDNGILTYEKEDPELGELFCVKDPRKNMGWGNNTMNVILGCTRHLCK